MDKPRTILITGGGTGIGRATALHFAGAGWRVAITGRRMEPLKEVVATIHQHGGQAMAVQADVSQEEDMEQAVTDVVTNFGGIDVVFANAGINGTAAPVDKLQPREWDEVINTNLRGIFLTVHYCVPHLRQRHGVILLHSSTQGTRIFSNFGRSAYAASKAAIVALGRMWALELAEARIRVNTICTGPIHGTEINHNHCDSHDLDMIRLNGLKRSIPIPLGFCGSPEDVARLVFFLASPEARYITGTEIWIDGGISLIKG